MPEVRKVDAESFSIRVKMTSGWIDAIPPDWRLCVQTTTQSSDSSFTQAKCHHSPLIFDNTCIWENKIQLVQNAFKVAKPQITVGPTFAGQLYLVMK